MNYDITASAQRARMADRLAEIRGRMASAAREAGRAPSEILLCAACKGCDSDMIRLSAELDIDVFGENRMQEMRAHLLGGAYAGKPCHFIGKLQTNKVREVVGKTALIHSVESTRLLSDIQGEAAMQGLVQDILFEVNLGLEKSKAGTRADHLRGLMDAAAACRNLRVRGLMAIPPAASEQDETRHHFAALRRLLEDMRSWNYVNAALDTLSMGMSDDYESAIREGATIVRIGRALYGERILDTQPIVAM